MKGSLQLRKVQGWQTQMINIPGLLSAFRSLQNLGLEKGIHSVHMQAALTGEWHLQGGQAEQAGGMESTEDGWCAG